MCTTSSLVLDWLGLRSNEAAKAAHVWLAFCMREGGGG
jgi:hypothetical protein